MEEHWEPSRGERVIADWGGESVDAIALDMSGRPDRRLVRVALRLDSVGPTSDPDEDYMTMTLPLRAVHPVKGARAGA